MTSESSVVFAKAVHPAPLISAPPMFVRVDTSTLPGTRAEYMVHINLSGIPESESALELAANVAGEVWQIVRAPGLPVTNTFVGYIGDRADGSKVFSRWFDLPADPTTCTLVARLHWIRPRGVGAAGGAGTSTDRSDAAKAAYSATYTNVTCRQTVDEPVLWVGTSAVKVTAALEDGYVVGQRSCSQQPRQGGYYPYPASTRVTVTRALGKAFGTIKMVLPSILAPLDAITVEPKVVSTKSAGSATTTTLIADLDRPGVTLPCLHDLCTGNPRALTHTVLDLGSIGSHRLEVRTVPGGPCVVLYAEVPTLALMSTGNRKKTKLADFVGSGCAGRIHGPRGCRFLHVFQDAAAAGPPSVTAFRLEYRLAWGDIRPVQTGPPETRVALAHIADAVIATITACLTGDAVVDTCWRERTRWTGDLYAFLWALSSLTHDGAEDLVTHETAQVADSYNAALGMVAAITPVPTHAALYIPMYHLLFCLLNGVKGTAPKARKRILASLAFWHKTYLKEDGLLRVPGAATDSRVWHFVDWAKGVSSRDKTPDMDCNGVLNALWVYVHKTLGMEADHGLNVDAYEAAFACASMPGAYSVCEDTNVPSVHATTMAILGGVAADVGQSCAALQTLLTFWRESPLHPDDFEHGGPTAFFSGFVCEALRVCEEADVAPAGTALNYAVQFYGPMAAKHGTLVEKKGDGASLAHAWSVLVARQVFEDNTGPKME